MRQQKLRPIVLAGGSGKRLWPLSTKERPKQFISFFGEYSLFDLTLQRLNKASLFKNPIIVTSEEYLSYVEDSITRTGIEPEKIILEPFSKNTFPAISLAVITALLKEKDENFIATPSDQYISKNKGPQVFFKIRYTIKKSRFIKMIMNLLMKLFLSLEIGPRLNRVSSILLKH